MVEQVSLIRKGDPEKEYELDEIVDLVYMQLRFIAGCSKDEVRFLLKQKHLTEGRKAGKFSLKETEAISLSDSALLDMFSEKLFNVKESVKNLSCDFSTW